ncbi:hypothetical protein BS78_01G359700 [Paspalum vaginatum]|nr:hypothetical protein BS78_01G359700 [Paspalum vaginatum]
MMPTPTPTRTREQPDPAPLNAHCPPISQSSVGLLALDSTRLSSPPPSPVFVALSCSPLQAVLLMARALSFVGFGGERGCCYPSSPDYSPLAASPGSRATSPEYKPVSLLWMPEHGPSTTLRLGPSTPPPLRRVASPDCSPLSPCCGWSAESPDYRPSDPPRRAASPDYAPPSTPTYGVASPEYTPVSREWRAAASPDYTPSDRRRRAASPDYAPSSLTSPPRSATAASPDYTPLTLPARAPPTPDYSPSTLPPSPLVSDAESHTSPPRRSCRRRHPYQRSGAPAAEPGAPVGSAQPRPAPCCLLGGSGIVKSLFPSGFFMCI